MSDFTMNELLERRGVSLTGTRFVRHDWRGGQSWRRGARHFDHFVSFQRDDARSPYNNAQLAIQFVPLGGSGAMFAGAHEIIDSLPPALTWRALPEYDSLIGDQHLGAVSWISEAFSGCRSTWRN